MVPCCTVWSKIQIFNYVVDTYPFPKGIFIDLILTSGSARLEYSNTSKIATPAAPGDVIQVVFTTIEQTGICPNPT